MLDHRPLILAAVTPFPAKKQASGYRVIRNAKSDSAEMYIYGPIGASWYGDGVTANQFRKDLKDLGNVKSIDVRINSEGGDVFDGKAIYTLLAEHKADVTVHIDGLAASAASFIAMAGSKIKIAESAFVMIHNASAVVWGGAGDMRKMADLLEGVNASLVGVYEARTKRAADDIRAWMDEETWMEGKLAVERGFVDVLLIRGQVLLTREGRDAWHPVVEDGINGSHGHGLETRLDRLHIRVKQILAKQFDVLQGHGLGVNHVVVLDPLVVVLVELGVMR